MNTVAKMVPNPVPLAVPSEVVAIREQLGMTQKELGQAIGVSEFSVWRWESGTRNITPRHTAALRRLYDTLR